MLHRYWGCWQSGRKDATDDFSKGCDGCKWADACKTKQHSLAVKKTAQSWARRWDR